MGENHLFDELDGETLAQLYHRRRYQTREQHRQRLRQNGRLVEIPHLPPPDSIPPIPVSNDPQPARNKRSWSWVAGKLMLLIEVTAVIALVAVFLNLRLTQTELNQELAAVQYTQSQAVALPTPTATPVIDVVVLPGGHKPPVDGRIPEPGEAGKIPDHLLPAINAYVPPPIPTPGPEQARRIEIPAIGVDSIIVPGMYDWEQLKLGVAQKIGSALPGQVGNMALAAHNDIYGEIFRYLDKLSPGDEIIVTTDRQRFIYVVRDTQIVEPTETWVLEPTEYASATLISCYPYRVNTQRIVIFADLAES